MSNHKERLTLDRFIKLDKEDAVNYDFKKEVFKIRGLKYNDENPIENILMYKGNIFYEESDCDRIRLTLDIYNKLWGDKLKKYTYFDDGNKKEFLPVNGETMNSFTRIYKIYSNTVIGNARYKFDNEELNRFARLTHSIGNFIPVYAEVSNGKNKSPFNSGRNQGAYDYWDLTMYDIKEYFDSQNNSIKERYSYKYIENSKIWLDSYERNWASFCEDNFLEEWKDIDGDELNNKLFWEKHNENRKNVDLFKNDEEKYNKMLKKINDSIVSRGERMYDKLKECM